MRKPLLVFDVGGGHITGALFRSAESGLLGCTSIPVRSAGAREHFYASLQQLIDTVLEQASSAQSQVAGLSFAFPGPFDYAAGISLLEHKFGSLYGVNLRDEFASR